MTKETKIGLLVGLAFIILFAIILSEKGTTHRDTNAPAFTVVDSIKGTPAGAANAQPLADAGKLPVESQLPLIVGPSPRAPAESLMKEEQVAEGPSTDGEPLPPLPSTLAELLKNPNSSFEAGSPTGPAANPTATETKEESALAAKETSPTPSLKKESEPVPSLLEEEIATRTEPKPVSSDSDKNTPAPSKLGEKAADATMVRPTHVKAEHTVQAGESIGKIAAKYYGRSSPARVAAIFESNRDVLKSVQSVRAGDKLKIPDLGSQFEPAPSFALTRISKESSAGPDSGIRIPAPLSEKANPVAVKTNKTSPVSVSIATKTAHSREPGYQWYEVRKNDTLSRIAKRELGNERMVKDICQLNKDVISNKHVLKPGTKIRIPARASTAAGTPGQPMLSSSGTDKAEP